MGRTLLVLFCTLLEAWLINSNCISFNGCRVCFVGHTKANLISMPPPTPPQRNPWVATGPLPSHTKPTSHSTRVQLPQPCSCSEPNLQGHLLNLPLGRYCLICLRCGFYPLLLSTAVFLAHPPPPHTQLRHCNGKYFRRSYWGNGNPLQYSCLENPMDRRAW